MSVGGTWIILAPGSRELSSDYAFKHPGNLPKGQPRAGLCVANTGKNFLAKTVTRRRPEVRRTLLPGRGDGPLQRVLVKEHRLLPCGTFQSLLWGHVSEGSSTQTHLTPPSRVAGNFHWREVCLDIWHSKDATPELRKRLSGQLHVSREPSPVTMTADPTPRLNTRSCARRSAQHTAHVPRKSAGQAEAMKDGAFETTVIRGRGRQGRTQRRKDREVKAGRDQLQSSGGQREAGPGGGDEPNRGEDGDQRRSGSEAGAVLTRASRTPTPKPEPAPPPRHEGAVHGRPRVRWEWSGTIPLHFSSGVPTERSLKDLENVLQA